MSYLLNRRLLTGALAADFALTAFILVTAAEVTSAKINVGGILGVSHLSGSPHERDASPPAEIRIKPGLNQATGVGLLNPTDLLSVRS
jgi:hypothetical protein